VGSVLGSVHRRGKSGLVVEEVEDGTSECCSCVGFGIRFVGVVVVGGRGRRVVGGRDPCILLGLCCNAMEKGRELTIPSS